MGQITRVLFRGCYVNQRTAEMLTMYLDTASYSQTAKRLKTTREAVCNCVSRYRKRGVIPDIELVANDTDNKDDQLIRQLWDLAHGRIQL